MIFSNGITARSRTAYKEARGSGNALRMICGLLLQLGRAGVEFVTGWGVSQKRALETRGWNVCTGRCRGTHQVARCHSFLWSNGDMNGSWSVPCSCGVSALQCSAISHLRALIAAPDASPPSPHRPCHTSEGEVDNFTIRVGDTN
jgi:hypothetical protein